MPMGSGAIVVHQTLAQQLDNYRVNGYRPLYEYFPLLLRKFSNNHANIIHTAADYAFIHRRKNQRLVATLHNYVLDPFMKDYSSLIQRIHYATDLRWFTKKSLERADSITAVSQFTADLARRDLGIEISIKVIYNGVDEMRFCPISNNNAIKKRPFRILFSGNLSLRKRAELLPPLARTLGPDFEIHYTAGLSGGHLNRAGKNAANLISRGRISHNKMHEVYQSVDALFMPSVREGFGLSIAEAMSCGLPIVANNCSAIPELVIHQQGGYLCPIDDLECYANAFRTLAENRDLGANMGEFNRARVESKFTIERMINEYQELFQSLM